MIFAAGLVLLVLGLLCGALLLLIPLGVIEGAAGMTLWVLFPVFAIGGYLMAASAAGNQNAAMVTRASGAALMVLALASAVVLVLQAAAIVSPSGDTLSLWYVLVLGIVLGAMGLASRKRADAASYAGVPGWFLYVIECADGSLYTGIATDPEARFQAHAAGKGARYTRSHPPLRLVLTEPHPDRSSASKAEYAFKQLTAAQKRHRVG